MADAPPLGSAAYRWWSQGAHAEAAARDEDLSAAVKSARDCLEGLARQRGVKNGLDTGMLCAAVAAIELAGRPLRYRLKAAWRILHS